MGVGLLWAEVGLLAGCGGSCFVVFWAERVCLISQEGVGRLSSSGIFSAVHFGGSAFFGAGGGVCGGSSLVGVAAVDFTAFFGLSSVEGFTAVASCLSANFNFLSFFLAAK